MIDSRAHLAGWTMGLADFYAKDVLALNQEQYDSGCGSVSRSARDISTEVTLMTRGAALVMAGEEFPARNDEAYKAEMERLATPEMAADAVRSAAKDLADAVNNASDELLSKEIMMPWGQPMSLYAMGHLAATHIMYHNGQLCYIQSLNGDAEMHWF